MITDQDIRIRFGQRVAETALRLAEDIDALTADNTISLDEWTIEGPAWDGASAEGWQERIDSRTPVRHISRGPQIAAWLRTIPDVIREIPSRAEYAALATDEKEDVRFRLYGELGDPADATGACAEEYLRQHMLAEVDVTAFRTVTDSEEIRQGGDPNGAGFYWWHAWSNFVDVSLGAQTGVSENALHQAMRILDARMASADA